MVDRSSGAWDAWAGFWFTPVSSARYALLRIGFAVLVCAWLVSLTANAVDFAGSHGAAPASQADLRLGRWGMLNGSEWRLWAAMSTTFCAALFLGAGLFTRLSAIVVFVGLMSLTRTLEPVLNSGDALIRIIAFYVVLMPAGASFSVDGWRRRRDTWTRSRPCSAWPLRLLQIQLTIAYLMAVWAKVRTQEWNDGTALSYALRTTDVQRFDLLAGLATAPLASTLFTYATLALEFAIAILVWRVRARAAVLLLGVVLHLGIDAAIRVGFFSFAMFILYASFVSDTAADRCTAAARAIGATLVRRLHRRRYPDMRHAAEHGHP